MTEPAIKNQTPPTVVLLFSTRERIRSVLAVGLLQCNFRVIMADTPYLAAIKASQFLPDIVIADITTDNTKDILLIARLKASLRTKSIPVLVVIPASISKVLDRLHADEKTGQAASKESSISVLEYPFQFADMVKKLKEISRTVAQLHSTAYQEQATQATVEKELFDAAIPVERKLRMIESALHKQWAFPYTVIKALDIIDSEASCTAELAKCISTDLAASTAVLKVANTVYYAKRESRITDVKDAVMRLGFGETRNLMACLALIEISPETYKSYGFNRNEFWLHSLATALIASKLCTDAGYRRPELAFIAGLVHDLGKLPLDTNFGGAFAKLLEDSATRVAPFYEVEKQLMGFSHATLGHYLTSVWNFPSSISMAILYHHDPDAIVSSPTPMDRILQEAVFAANIFAKAMGMGHSCDEMLRDIPGSILRDLHLPMQGPSDRFFAGIFRNLSVLCQYLNISDQKLIMAKTRPEDPPTDIMVIYSDIGKNAPYTPVVTALRNNGFTVKITSQFTPQIYEQARIFIFLLDKGIPIDITLHEEEHAEDLKNLNILKIFMLDVLPYGEKRQEEVAKNVIVMDRRHLDLRMVLHTIDQYLDQIVVPVKQKIEEMEQG